MLFIDGSELSVSEPESEPERVRVRDMDGFTSTGVTPKLNEGCSGAPGEGAAVRARRGTVFCGAGRKRELCVLFSREARCETEGW